jgi:hypothetical protein
MTLRDRLRRWWSPAQADDDHPAERKRRDQPNKNAGDDWVSNLSDWARKVAESNFKKPR